MRRQTHPRRIVSSAEQFDSIVRNQFKLLMNNYNANRILVTSGSTREPIDQVRYLSNKSSGRLGCLIAIAAAIEHYEVTLLHSDCSISPTKHPRLTSIPFSSCRDLDAKLQEQWPSHDVLIMAAAVSDFTPKGGQTSGKITRTDSQKIDLISTKDIVASISHGSTNCQRIIAFALEEASNLETAGRQKLAQKKVDAIIANPLETMESNQITATIYCKNGKTITPPNNLPKSDFAFWLIQNLEDITATI